MDKLKILRLTTRQYVVDLYEDEIYILLVKDSPCLDTLVDMYMGYITYIYGGEHAEPIMDLGDEISRYDYLEYGDDRDMSPDTFIQYLKDHGIEVLDVPEVWIEYYNTDVYWC